LARVDVHSESARFVTMATRPPSEWTRRVSSGAPGIAGAARSFTHAAQLASV
jgi:hypothetical protein